MRRWVLVAWLGACGPVAYVNQTTMQAQTAVDQAREAGADKYSPYWWTRATQYLHMSREVAAHADFQGANRFGKLATEAAKKAIEESATASKEPPKPAVAPAKTEDVAPAKETP
jgi:hypothetical protein